MEKTSPPPFAVSGTAALGEVCEGPAEVLRVLVELGALVDVPFEGTGTGLVMVMGGMVGVGVSPLGMDISGGGDTSGGLLGLLVWMVGATEVGSVRGFVSGVVMGVSPWGIDIIPSVEVVPGHVSHDPTGCGDVCVDAHMRSKARRHTPRRIARWTYPLHLSGSTSGRSGPGRRRRVRGAGRW